MTADIIPFRGSCRRCGGFHDQKECAVQDAVAYLAERFSDVRDAVGWDVAQTMRAALTSVGFSRDEAIEALQRWRAA